MPETNAIEPFIAKDAQGTYVLMADGSVRFVTRDISDSVVKSMSTYQGPGVNLAPGRPDARLIPDPKDDKKEPVPKKTK